jgi:enamine deaminase RidA (YjgF/YER057c/UK114 family)
MSAAEEKIRQLGIELPKAPRPVGDYVPAVRTGKLVYTSGQLPTVEGKLIAEGKVDCDVSVEQGQTAARTAGINALAAIRGEIGSLDKITRIVRLNVFVNSASGFKGQSQVANGASALLVEIFGESARHTRCAIGASELPLNSPVELDMIVEID